MGVDQRTINLGRKAELEERIKSLAWSINSHVQSLKDLFEPRTVDLSYIKDVDPERLRVFSADIAKEVKKYKGLLEELKAVKKELGIEEDD